MVYLGLSFLAFAAVKGLGNLIADIALVDLPHKGALTAAGIVVLWAIMQRVLARRYLGLELRGWMRWTFAGVMDGGCG